MSKFLWNISVRLLPRYLDSVIVIGQADKDYLSNVEKSVENGLRSIHNFEIISELGDNEVDIMKH